jgi:hypothetical protein
MGLISIVEWIGKASLQLLLGERARMATDRAFMLRMCIGGTILGVVIGLVTFPFAPLSDPPSPGEVNPFKDVNPFGEDRTLGDWLPGALVIGLACGCLLGVAGLWLEGKDIRKV